MSETYKRWYINGTVCNACKSATTDIKLKGGESVVERIIESGVLCEACRRLVYYVEV